MPAAQSLMKVVWRVEFRRRLEEQGRRIHVTEGNAEAGAEECHGVGNEG